MTEYGNCVTHHVCDCIQEKVQELEKQLADAGELITAVGEIQAARKYGHHAAEVKAIEKTLHVYAKVVGA